MPEVRIAVVGAGLIGRQHVARIVATDGVGLAAIVDPAPRAAPLAAKHDAPCYPTLADLLAVDRPDGVIVATPSALHEAHGLEVLQAGIAALVEKPLADTLDGAERLVEAAERAGVALLVGHHRRHNPLIVQAKQAIDSGRIGTVVAAHMMCWLAKPPDYFEPAWRRAAGAGPLLTNLIHDVDLLRALLGDVDEVQAMHSHAQRGHAVEDTAGLLLRLTSGALATLTVSDAIAAPWSWEFTSGENPAYSRTTEPCYMIGGTMGSIAIPTLDFWSHRSAPDWRHPLDRTRLDRASADPLARQVANFRDVIRGRALAVAPGREGLETLRVIVAAQRAAATRQPVRVR